MNLEQIDASAVGEMADLITFAQSWPVEHDVRLSDQAPKRLARYAA